MEQKKHRGLGIASVVFLVIDTIALIALTLYAVLIRSSFLKLYEGMNMTMPIVTKIALLWGPYFFIIGGLILIIKERLRRKLVAFAINIVAFIIVLFCALLYILAIFLPMYRLGQIAG